MIRSRTSFLVSERNAALISFSRPSNCSASFSLASALTRSVSASRSCLPGDRERVGELAGDFPRDRLVHVLAVVDEHRVLGRCHGAYLIGQALLRLDQHAEERLGRLEALGHRVLGRRHGAAVGVGDQLERLRGGLGLDHHDGHFAVLKQATRDHHVEGGLTQLLVRREPHPLALDQRDPHPADGAGERQARQLGGHRRGVDRHHVVQVLRVERENGLDDLDLVAQALDERRAQRPVDQAAGKDRVLGRTALATEKRAGDPAHRVHPLFHVHREREEVQVVLRLLRCRGRGEHHGLAVESYQGRTGGLAGQPARLEPDCMYAKFAVINDGFGTLGTLHG